MTIDIPNDWKPTAENVNALPEPLRRYIMEIETLCDPAGIVRENVLVRDWCTGLQREVRRLKIELTMAEGTLKDLSDIFAPDM